MATKQNSFAALLATLLIGLITVNLCINIINAQDENSATTEQVQNLKAQKLQQNDFLEVLNVLQQQQSDLSQANTKKKLLDTKEAIEISGAFLDALNITTDQFTTMLSNKQTQLQSVMSLELELKNLVALTQNSANIIGDGIKNFVGTFTKKAYTVTQYQNTSKEIHDYSLTFSQVDSIVPNYLTAQPVRRIRNRLSVGALHALILGQNGKLYSTGYAYNGNLGRTNSDSRSLYSVPVEGLNGLSILQFEANAYSNLVLTNDGVYAFGQNEKSQMGTGDRNNRLIAGKVYGFGGQTVAQIALGQQAAYAIDTNGKLWAWGSNDYGQLGDRTFSEKNRPFPVYSYGAINSTSVVRVCGGSDFAIALLSNNNLVGFGNNFNGRIGVNSATISKSGEPVLVGKPADLANKTIVDIQCGYDFAMALTSSGDVYAWGSNGFNQFGDNTLTPSSLPKKLNVSCTVAQIHTKYQSVYALCTDNTLYSWGKNGYGQLGREATTSTPVPTIVANFATATDNYLGVPKIIEISSNLNNLYILTSDLSVYAAGTCSTDSSTLALFNASTTYSYGNCNVPYTNKAIYGTSPQKVTTFYDMSFPVAQRKSQYFEIGSRAYLLQTDPVIPTRPNNGFNMYYKEFAAPEDAWSLLERNETSNAGFPVSIYNSHFLKSDEYVYFFGGFQNDEISNKVYRAPIYDVENGWEVAPFTLPYAVASGMTAVINGYIYIFGGMTSMYSYNVDVPYQNPVLTNQIIRAPLSNLTNWMVISGKVLPSPLHSASIAVLDKYVYLYGGSPSAFTSSQEIYRALITDPATWEMTFGILPFFSSNSALISTGSDLLLIGGTAKKELVNGGFIGVGNATAPVGSWMASDVFLPTDAAQALVPVIRNNTVLLYGTELRRSTSYTPHSSRIGRVLKLVLNLF